MEAKTTSAGASKPKGYTHSDGLGAVFSSTLRHIQTMYTVSAQRVFATMIDATVCQNIKLLMGASLRHNTPPRVQPQRAAINTGAQ